MMNWASLYSPQRTGDPAGKGTNPDRGRTSYIRDYDRLIFSSAFRRLQNKTQVFPLPGSVFVHNRLTHSLEVASVGRSLGKEVGEAIAAKYGGEDDGFRDFYRHELGAVIASACLAHDIGNPPFGHSGEDAIRSYFTSLEPATRARLEATLTPNQLRDFDFFEGNSNAFRILTHSFGGDGDAGGYKLTYATLAAMVKYPCNSLEGFTKKTGLIATKKSGFFDGESGTWRGIAETLGIPRTGGFDSVYARHPFVYLTEAADDICYRVIDMEDAHRLRIISLAEFEDLFVPFFEKEGNGWGSQAYVKRKLEAIDDPNQRVQYLRAVWIGRMVEGLTKAFLEQEEALLAGTLNKDLLSCLPEKECALIKEINAVSVSRIYNYGSVLQIEVAGYHVIGGLLQELLSAVLHPSQSKSAKALRLIPAQYSTGLAEGDLYQQILSVVDFISGMTDLYALDLYRTMTGITIPELR